MMFLGFFRPKPIGESYSPIIFVSLKYHTLEKGQIKSLYDEIMKLNKTGLQLGFQPYCTNTWSKQKEYLMEYDNIPVMLNVMSSDSIKETKEQTCLLEKLSCDQIEEATKICNVKFLRFHEIKSYYKHEEKKKDFPSGYVRDILELSQKKRVPVFWNEWDFHRYSEIKNIIDNNGVSFADNVIVSFATNNDKKEPADGFKLLNKFKRKGASVQSWYWWERKGKKAGYEKLMPSTLMRQHTSEAITAGCEVVQYEPMGYFIDEEWKAKNTLQEILKERF